MMKIEKVTSVVSAERFPIEPNLGMTMNIYQMLDAVGTKKVVEMGDSGIFIRGEADDVTLDELKVSIRETARIIAEAMPKMSEQYAKFYKRMMYVYEKKEIRVFPLMTDMCIQPPSKEELDLLNEIERKSAQEGVVMETMDLFSGSSSKDAISLFGESSFTTVECSEEIVLEADDYSRDEFELLCEIFKCPEGISEIKINSFKVKCR